MWPLNEMSLTPLIFKVKEDKNTTKAKCQRKRGRKKSLLEKFNKKTTNVKISFVQKINKLNPTILWWRVFVTAFTLTHAERRARHVNLETSQQIEKSLVWFYRFYLGAFSSFFRSVTGNRIYLSAENGTFLYIWRAGIHRFSFIKHTCGVCNSSKRNPVITPYRNIKY